MLYGMGAITLSETLHISEDDAHKLISEFKSTFTGVNKYFNDCVTLCRSMGLVKTLSGRIRHLPDINSDIPKIKCEFSLFAIVHLSYLVNYFFFVFSSSRTTSN